MITIIHKIIVINNNNNNHHHHQQQQKIVIIIDIIIIIRIKIIDMMAAIAGSMFVMRRMLLGVVRHL